MSVRIPIRKWEQVETSFDGYSPPTPSERYYGNTDKHYVLEVLINGETLRCKVTMPSMLRKDSEEFRRHIIAGMSRQIGGIIADEIQRSIA